MKLSAKRSSFFLHIFALILCADQLRAASNRTVNWWLGSYTSAFVKENKIFLDKNHDVVSGILHCCRGIQMMSNGSISHEESDGPFFRNLTSFEVDGGYYPVLVPISPNTDALLANVASHGIATLVHMASSNRFDGYVVDYEPHSNLTQEHARAFTDFLTQFRMSLHAQQKTLAVCVSDWGIIGPNYYSLLATSGANYFLSMGSTYKRSLMNKFNVQQMLKSFPLESIGIGIGTMVPSECHCVYGNAGNCTEDYDWTETTLKAFLSWIQEQGIGSVAVWRADIYPAYCDPSGIEPWFVGAVRSFLEGTLR
eukprot:m.623192 g.623192  ORF g.623192 m.623192 type:complete len:310 (-) comp22544_c1_seq5:1480-2409(-)